MRTPRRPVGSIEAAEAAFKAATTKPMETLQPRTSATTPPMAKEMVSLRLDRDVLEHFQDDGPGWQERINAYLRGALED